MRLGDDESLLRSLIEHALSDRSGPRRWHVTRVAMYRALSNVLAQEDGSQSTCLSISRSDELARITGLRRAQLVPADYPEANMLALPYEDAAFDAVVSDQVLEHVEGDPVEAVRETLRVLKPGGYMVHTTCFINFIHMPQHDFWRFTPDALRLLCRLVGAEAVQVDGWGNRDVWTYMNLGYRMSKVPEVKGNPIFDLAMRSDKRWPITTWMVARKAL